jgi:hypothetical protein
MEIEAKDPSYELGEKATYVTVNGVKHAIVRADTWFDQIGTENAPAPGGKALLLPLGHVIKGSGKFYGVKTVKLALNPDHPAYHAAVHRATLPCRSGDVHGRLQEQAAPWQFGA